MTTLSSFRPSLPVVPVDPDQVLELERGEDEEVLASFWQQATPGTTYVRCLLPARALPGQCLRMRAEDIDWDSEKDILLMPRQRGAAVWQFLGDPWRSKVAWGQQEQLGLRVLMEIDDNYTVDIPQTPGRPRAWSRTIKESMAPGQSGYSYEMHKKICPTFDGLIVSTAYLGSVYENFNENVYVCRNTVDPADWVDLEEKDPSVLRVVYSGSPSHHHDAPFVTKAFKWLARQDGIEVHTQGFNPRGWTVANVDPWTPTLARYRKRLGAFDIGVAPLKATRWANGKSDLKVLEYAMAGVLPLAAREEPYREFLEVFPELGVESHELAWLEAVKKVVKDRDFVKTKLAEVRQYVLEHRTIYNSIASWREAILGPS